MGRCCGLRWPPGSYWGAVRCGVQSIRPSWLRTSVLLVEAAACRALWSACTWVPSCPAPRGSACLVLAPCEKVCVCVCVCVAASRKEVMAGLPAEYQPLVRIHHDT